MYGKIFESMYDGTLATNGPWEAIVTFQQLIALSDKFGAVDMTPEAIARRTTIPVRIIKKGLLALEASDPLSRIPDEEGRRIIRISPTRDWGWRIVNHAHYQKLHSLDHRQTYHQEYYEKKKREIENVEKSMPCETNSTPSTLSTNSTESTNSTPHTHTHTHTQTLKEKYLKKDTKRKSDSTVSTVSTNSTQHQRPASIRQELWDDFLVLRKAKRAPLTASALKGLEREGAKANLSLCQVLEKCCRNGWQGFNATWKEQENDNYDPQGI